jgi:hypothetical protein
MFRFLNKHCKEVWKRKFSEEYLKILDRKLQVNKGCLILKSFVVTDRRVVALARIKDYEIGLTCVTRGICMGNILSRFRVCVTTDGV